RSGRRSRSKLRHPNDNHRTVHLSSNHHRRLLDWKFSAATKIGAPLTDLIAQKVCEVTRFNSAVRPVRNFLDSLRDVIGKHTVLELRIFVSTLTDLARIEYDCSRWRRICRAGSVGCNPQASAHHVSHRVSLDSATREGVFATCIDEN